MHVGIIGSGHIGGNLGRLLAKAGHRVYFSFSHDGHKLEELAASVGENAKAATPYDAAMCSEVIIFSPPWTAIEDALHQSGPLEGKVVIDTTNPYDKDFNLEPLEIGSSECVARKIPDAQLVKAFNTLQAQTLLDKSGQGLAVFYCGDDTIAKRTVEKIIRDVGFEPIDTGRLVDGKKQEPNTPIYNRELTADQAREALQTA
ncbi:MAG: NAD(P)-binding domain-containing protein [Candidatus Eremiobacteraeota bacterium]|nr:NAD(P)-binding domain-containing protein [Candidatus Eremiobacteraeota bacterium]